ncbi:CaiB/BaiF CoA transferase family protein [Nocardioides alcanivorans]|uniref:CaiB/BaiF CoA transferase family protein n=1 Tax=Nocardioides alcanivorans TaxID=2897352 RepID=UPI001F3D65EE|nr:CoA transferase [Nocardioides alcanivorans]
MMDTALDGLAPLKGVTVVDLTVNIAGPSATLMLADLGARVIKVEPPGGDISREWTPRDETGVSTVFSAFNRGKESIVIDAKTAEGRRTIHRLVAEADVFVESMRPGKAATLGLGWEDLSAINERLVYCSVNAFGDVGPLAGVAGFDAVIQAYSGLMELTGYPDGEPARVGGAVVDVGTGTWAALGVVAALLQRERDGRGQRVQMTLLGTAIGYMMHHLLSARLAGVEPKRLGTAQHNFAPYQAIRAADGMVMIGVNSDPMWRRAAVALGAERLIEDPRFADNASRNRNRLELIAEIEACISQVPADVVVERLMGATVPASAVRSIGSLIGDAQLEAMGLWATTPSGVPLPRTPVADPTAPIGEVPLLGEHNQAILAEIADSDGLVDDICRSASGSSPAQTKGTE